jgi:radical SAM protein with 4Fe4S-binding SPASM domain
MDEPPVDPCDLDDVKRKLAWRGEGASRGRTLRVFMDQNNRCNLKCRMCGFSDPRVADLPKYDMPPELFDTIAREVFPRTNILILSCFAEPFMTRVFPERLAAVRKTEVPYSEIITNGTLLNEANIRKILEAEITRLTVSVDGGTKAVYEAIRTGANFQVVMYNVALFQSMRKSRRRSLPELQINHVLSEPNIDHFDSFLALAGKIRPERICVRTVSRMSDAVLQQSADPEFWRKVRDARDRLKDFCHRTGIEDAGFLRDRPTTIRVSDDDGEELSCRAPWENLAIFPNGDVYPCIGWTRRPIGNLLRQPFEAIWEGEEVAALRLEFERKKPGVDCLNCTIRKNDPSEMDDLFYIKVARPLTKPVVNTTFATVSPCSPLES